MEILRNISDVEWIELCKAGNPTAYKVLYDKYAKSIYNTLFRIVQHSAEAEDLLQETFISAFQGLDRLQDVKGFGPWIKRIAINKALDGLRKRRILVMKWDEDTMQDLEEDSIDDEDTFEFKVAEVKDAIAALPDGYRTIVQLYLFDELAQEEIAELLGISHVTVRTQYHRARNRILKTIKNRGNK